MRSKILLSILLVTLIFSVSVSAKEEIFSLVDEEGNIITKTSLMLSEGDIYISADNSEYEVIGKEDDKFKVHKKGTVDLSAYLTYPIEIQTQGGKPIIGIYHTHSDESYAPGEPSRPYPGQIYQVGKALKDALEEHGFQVDWSQANHNPHDGAAYTRSRDTAAKLLKNNPITVIDVHRDAVPDPEFYSTEIEGQSAAKVRIVTGKQNQNRTGNFEYAKALKAKADNNYPGIIEGIFWAKGNYNQDLGPRMILLEFGTHVLPLEDALVSAHRFADVIAASLPEGGGRAERSGAKSGVFWVILLALGGLGIFLLINKEGLSRLKNIGQRFTHALRKQRGKE